MEYAQDPQFLAMVFILPGLFGFSLIGEGVSKIMNYDPRGWVGVIAGAGFVIIIILAYFLLTTKAFG
jgi:hypothetical protein